MCRNVWRIPLDLPVEIVRELYKRLYAVPQASNAGPVLLRGSASSTSGDRPSNTSLMSLAEPIGQPEAAPDLATCLKEVIKLSETDMASAGATLVDTVRAALRSHHFVTLFREWAKTEGGAEIFWRRRAVRTLREIFGEARGRGIKFEHLSRVEKLLASIEAREPRGKPSPALLVITAIAASVGIMPRARGWLRLVAADTEVNTLVCLVSAQPISLDGERIGGGINDTLLQELGKLLQLAEESKVPLMQPLKMSMSAEAGIDQPPLAASTDSGPPRETDST